MKKLLDSILNNRKKPAKINGRIVGNPRHLQYIIVTNNGKMRVEAPVPYKLGDRVVVYDGLIQGRAGSEPPATSSVV